MVDFVKASPLMYALTFTPTVYVSHIRQFWSTARIETTEEGTEILATIDSILRTVTESSLRKILSFKMRKESGEGSATPTKPHHTPSPEAQPSSHTTHSSPIIPFITTALIPPVTSSDTPPIRQYTRRTRIAQSSDRATIAKSSTLPHDSAPRVTSPAADEGSMQQTINELTALCTSLQRQYFEMIDKFQAQEVEINRLKARVKLLKDKEGMGTERSGDDAPIKGRNLDEGEAAAERVTDDTEEMATVLTSIDAATFLASGVVGVPTSSGSIPTTSPPAAEVPTGSDVVPTASLVFATATVVTPYRRRKGKEVMIARDAEIAQIHAEEELQIMIDTLDRSNEIVAKYLQEYQQFASELPLERRIELISNLIKYQDNYAMIYKYQSQQRKHLTKKQQREFYAAVLRNQARWKAKHFKGMTLEEIKENFDLVWKQLYDFVPIGSKEEAERFKRKGTRFEQESIKKLKTSEEVPEEVKSPDEVPEEKELLEDYKVGRQLSSYQFFIDMLKHLDREDLNQLWRIVKESLSNRPPTSDKEMELWVELNRLYKPDEDDQLWTHTQNLMHALVEWKLYDSCGVHHVTARDKEIFMLVEKDYPLRKVLRDSKGRIVGNKMHKAFPLLVIEFPLVKEVPTASEESSHCQKKRDATTKRIALLGKCPMITPRL
uniref:Uncharacterized protein n=1 Tax=Tanacetum cinerariifolium TaxID=118510 RepID=A0A6L2NP81_TANCI|nr:hypothetical protein [Tanacetum cinerariifolium]